MATIDRPSTGQLLLFGQPADSSEANIRGRIGYLPQNVGAPHGLTPRDLVTYVARLRGMVAQVESRVEEALEMAGALPFANRRIRRLSGGQRQRAGIAAAIVGTPPLVLLDEPTSGLDPEQRVAFRSLIRHLATRATVVLSTHLVEDVAHGCETVTILNRGHVLFDGPTERLLEVWHGISSNEASALEQAYMSLMRSDDSGLIA
jgi:ABC-type multidrug transport system ATPase subunit